MKRTLTSITLVILCASLLILASNPVLAQSGPAQKAQTIKASNILLSFNCDPVKRFIFGSGAQYFEFCLSPNGNITRFYSPAGFSPNGNDGYVACGTGAANAFETGSFESGWGAPTASQPGGSNTVPLTITRQSTDGKFELQQVFDWNGPEKEILITMTLKNTSAASISNVKLARYFFGSINGTGGNDLADHGSDSATNKDVGSGAGHNGVAMTALSFAISHTPVIEENTDWNPDPGSSGAQTARTCTPIPKTVPDASSDIHVERITYNLGTLAAGVSKTVQVLYRRF